MLFGYDFDGVLFDTRDAVYMSWRKVGVEPPEDFWKRDWKTWFFDAEKYAARNEIFISQCLNFVHPLPMLDVAARTGGFILSNGAERRVHATLHHFCGIHTLPAMCGLSVTAKIDCLNSKHHGIFFEDVAENVELLRKGTKWRIVHVTQS